MTVNIEWDTERIPGTDYEEIIRKVVLQALSMVHCPYEAEVNTVLTDNRGIQDINRAYRAIDQPTDVLSFPMIEYDAAGDFETIRDNLEQNVQDFFNPDTGELILGDIVISVEKVAEQADKYGHTQTRELAFLTAHSMMHLFGYDHMTAAEAAVMEEKQREVLQALQITR